MCNFSEGVYQKGKQEGLIAAIKTIMDTMDLTIDQAMNALRIPDSDKSKYLELLRQKG